MLKSQYEFEVLVNGHPAKEYHHQGSYYIEGKEGSRFSLRMRNNSGHRVLFVPTVDGLSIMSGKEASFKSRGYIVGAYDALTIDGWRTSDSKVAEFFFSTPKNSYANKVNRGGNLGVIGCVVFKEAQKKYEPCQTYHTHLNRYGDWSTFNMNAAGGGGGTLGKVTCTKNLSNTVCNNASSGQTSASAGLGTGFGQEKASTVVTVSFDKEQDPTATFSIYYNTRKNLEEAGVEFIKPVYTASSAFPNEEGYCEKPY